MTIGLTLTTYPLQASSGSPKAPSSQVSSKPVESEEAACLMARLAEIKNIEKSKLSFLEKKQLRMEVRSIKKELKALGEGIYISAGAVIVIIILLIILL